MLYEYSLFPSAGAPGGRNYAIESAARSDLIKVIDLEPGPWPPGVS
jgi:hypothetical protein